MESVVTHAWVNGQWTAQTNSRDHLMAQNQQFESSNEASHLPVADQDAPVYGLLTRTLVHSPVVKQIIPARIRGKDLNDVVFVGETFIQVHLLTEDGKLRLVGSKTNFRANIRHARVFGSPRKHFYSAQDAIFKQELASQLQDDIVMQGEEVDGCEPLLPPHILALTLDSGYIAFIYAKNSDRQGEVEFIVSMTKLDSSGVYPTHLGKSIAVDPRSRALAVAAYQDSFRLYSLRSVEELERQVQQGLPLDPIKEEKTFPIKGLILHMEFLHPSKEDQDHVILILFIIEFVSPHGPEEFSNQISRLQLYEWWDSKPLHTASLYGRDGLRLSNDISMPLHVIPLVIGSAFLLVTEFTTHVVKASEIMAGNTCFPKIVFPPVPPNGQKRMLVTAWARPLRTPNYAHGHDDMYLAMEDGDIYFLEVDSRGPNLIQLANKACRLDCTIGTAFASLDFGLTKNDMLIAGGEMSSGGVYILKVGPHPVELEPKLEESVANWSPVIDFELINQLSLGHSSGRAERDRIFAATGRGDHGAVTEIRYGIQARIQASAEYLPGVRRLWVLPDGSGKGYFLLSALPSHSGLFFLSPAGEWEDADEFQYLELSETTLAAGAIGQWSLQVTPNHIILSQLREEDIQRGEPDTDYGMDNGIDSSAPSLRRRCENGQVIVAAAVKGYILVIAIRDDTTVKLTLATVSLDGGLDNFLKPIGVQTSLSEDPTFISIIEISGRIFVMVGTRQASIQIFLLDLSAGLVPHLEESMIEANARGQPDLYICESVVHLTSSGSSKLLCGLRGGTVVIFDVIADSLYHYSISLKRVKDIRFGPIAVQLHQDVWREDSAFVLAGPELYRFDLPRGKFRAAQVMFEQTDTEPSLSAFAQVDNRPDSENIVVCATRKRVFYADIGDSQKVCIRRLRLDETPRRLLFYKPLNVLIVACSKTSFDDTRTEVEKDRKTKSSYYSLRFLDPRTGKFRADKNIDYSSKKDFIFGKANEQIYCLAEWNIKVEEKPYCYIILGTGYINASKENVNKGRVLVLSLTVGSEGVIEVRHHFQIQCDDPVYSIAPYGNGILVYCAGKRLFIKKLSNQSNKFENVAETLLPSPAVQISVSEPFICLSCTSDSMLVMKYDGNKIDDDIYGDETARNGFHHFQLMDKFFLVTDKQYGITGLWQPPDRRNVESMATIFEAVLSSSISRIRRGNFRPPWFMKRSRPGVLDVEQDLIATGVDGSVHHLTLLDENALRLLRYVQYLYYCTKSETVEEEGKPCLGHVNGDVLAIILELGPGWLRDTLASVEGHENIIVPTFRELATKLLDIEEEADSVEAVMEYINGLVNEVVL